MKILLTGVTGFIGGHLLKALLERNHAVHAVIRSDRSQSSLDARVNLFKYNGETEELIKFCQTERFDGVVHLASLFLASHQPGDITNLIDSNVRFGTQLLEAAKTADVSWFINTGTFWQNYNNEDYNPVNLYAATKEAFAAIAKYYTETSELNFCTIKLNDTFGPGDTRPKIFNLLSKISRTGESLEMSKGEQLMDISYIEDVVAAYIRLIENLAQDNEKKFRNKIFSVKSGRRVTLKELVHVFEETTGRKLNILWGQRNYREREVLIPWTGGETVPGWKPQHTMAEAIKKTVQELEDE